MKKPKKKIFVVEDDQDIRESIEVMLRLNNFEVTTFHNAATVLSEAEKQVPDLIIMDVMMPPPDGYSACQALKSNHQTSHIPILLLSARTQQPDVETGFNAGADWYLAKPFANEDLLCTIAELTQKRGHQ